MFCWVVIFKGGVCGWWWGVVKVTWVGDKPISCCAVLERKAVVFSDIVFPRERVPMEEIPLIDSVNVEEFDWLFSTVVTGGVIPLLREDLSCPCRMLFKVCVLLDDLW